MSKYTEYYDEWEELYKNGMECSEIATKYGSSCSTVHNLLRKRGIPPRKPNDRCSHMYEEWERLYKSGLSTIEISNVCKCGKSTVHRYLQSIGISRSIREYYQINPYVESRSQYHFFDDIDTEKKAYWLGFIYADGNVINTKSHHHMALMLSALDTNHLRKFANIFDIPIHTRTRDGRKYATATVNSKHVAEQLISKGIVQGKTYIDAIDIFDYIPDYLMHHFVRGFFDGDGCVSVYLNRNKIPSYSCSVSFSGREVIMSMISTTVGEACDIRIAPARTYGTSTISYSITWGAKNDILLIYRWMYMNANVFLDRKYNKFNDYINIINGG